MGLRRENGASRRDPVARHELHRTRFGAYFPRVFAFGHSLTADETAAKEAAVEAFSRAFAQRGDFTEEEFVLLLFSSVRDYCRGILPERRFSDDLDGRERELLALVFDARLNRELIRKLLRSTEHAISAILIAALRKVGAGVSPATADRSLRTA
jgi:DNA-directed RNA polymerase specialized sigma24 family protein